MKNPPPTPGSEPHDDEWRRFAAIVNSSAQAIFTTRLEGAVIDSWNQGAERVFGYTEEEIIGQPVGILVPPERMAESKAFGARLAAGEHVSGHETERLRKDGERVSVLVNLSPVRDAQGRVVAVANILQDIGERKRAEQALQAAQAAYRSIFENARVTLYRSTLEGRMLDCNPAFASILGYDSPRQAVEMLTEVRSQLYVNAAERDRLIADLRASGWVECRELQVRRRDGRRIWIDQKMWLVPDADGSGHHIEGAWNDITARKEAELALSARTRELTSLLEHTPDGILRLDRALCHRYVNRALLQASGRKAEEFIGRSLGAVWEGELFPLDEIEARVREVLETGRPRAMDFEWRRAGRTRWLDSRIVPEVDEDGRIASALWVARDVTETRRAGEELAKVTRALRTISGCNRALVRAGDERELMGEMCRVVVEEGDYLLAWVGSVQDDGRRTVKPIAWAGSQTDYVEGLRIEVEDEELGQGPAGTALRTGEVQVVEDVEEDRDFVPWRRRALLAGIRSLMVLPLADEAGTPFAVLCIYSGEVGAFNARAARLLAELADDLAYGIRTLRTRAVARTAARALRESEERLRRVIERAVEGLVVVGEDDRVVFVNRAAESILGRERGSLIGEVLEFSPAGAEDTLIDLGHVGGPQRHVQVRVTEIEWGGETARMVSLHDLTERVRYESRITHLANHDALTGLPNRNLLDDRLDRLIAHALRGGEQVAVAFLDLDGFKHVNDSLGHQAGDRLLREAAARLVEAVRAEDTVARFGGDEFVVVAPQGGGHERLDLVLRKLCAVFEAPFEIDGHRCRVTASIGGALCPEDGEDAATLLSHADAAAYRAKELGGDRFEFYTRSMGVQAHRRLSMEAELRQALERGNIEIWYQPQVSFATGAITGAEALVRWRHPERGVVEAAEFIGLAEETGLVLDLGAQVLERACADAGAWSERGLGEIRVAVNLAARQLWQCELEKLIVGVLERYGLPAPRLEIEITENGVMRDLRRAARALSRIAALGVGIAIDDFGTGHSSLNHLRRLPLDRLKIDHSFVTALGAGERGSRLGVELVRLAHALELEVVAEGVETRAQARLLAGAGCEQMQGYLFSRPVPEAEFRALLSAGRRLEL